jgi:hypothetical protein
MKHPSTRSPDDLPSIDDLIRLSKGLAMLDAILSPEWDYRYYSFLASIEHIYAGEPLTEDVVRSLNHEVTGADIEADASQIAYGRV